jgi:NAD(P)-dependent dehydrogenase (short-subunit alcohol dehydrogenase family)
LHGEAAVRPGLPSGEGGSPSSRSPVPAPDNGDRQADKHAARDEQSDRSGEAHPVVDEEGDRVRDRLQGSDEDTSLEDWERTVAIDQTGVFLGMKTAAAALAVSGHGSVINISSIFGTSGGFGTSPAYHAAKGAVRTLTKNTALHWADRGVRVNSVHPGFIDTPILAPTRGTEFEQAMISMTPLGRLGRPEEVAAGVAYLASDDASFVTGSELYIDGGYIAR